MHYAIKTPNLAFNALLLKRNFLLSVQTFTCAKYILHKSQTTINNSTFFKYCNSFCLLRFFHIQDYFSSQMTLFDAFIGLRKVMKRVDFFHHWNKLEKKIIKVILCTFKNFHTLKCKETHTLPLSASSWSIFIPLGQGAKNPHLTKLLFSGVGILCRKRSCIFFTAPPRKPNSSTFFKSGEFKVT